MKKILLVLAHPDDETFYIGGTVLKYVKAGWRVDLLCATKGEAGQMGPYDETYNLAELRAKELAAAASVLGITTVAFLGYIDANLSTLHPGDLEEAVFQKMLELAPDIVITFEPNGISNHPDHMKICLSTTFAFQKYVDVLTKEKTFGNRDPKRYLLRHTEPEETIEPKLYFTCMPDSIAEYLKKQHVVPDESFGKPWTGVADKAITTVIDISKQKNQKIEAIGCHVTQTGDIERFLSLANHPLLKQEYFILRMHGKQEVFMGNNDKVSNRL